MTFKQVEKILNKYHFYGFTVSRGEEKLRYTFHSVPYYAVNIIVDVIKFEKERIVAKVTIGNIEINDEKELIPTLNGIYKIHKKILFGCQK
jgi:hypothetical protein